MAVWKVNIGKSYNKAKIIELILTVNYFYAAFGVFTSILVWTNRYSSLLEFDSIVGLLGHVTCSVLVPAMVIPIMERMREEVNPDIPSQPAVVPESGNEPMEHGSQESSGTSSTPTDGHEPQQSEIES